MHISSFAPELSAALSLVCGCIMSLSPYTLLRLLDDLCNAPVLVFAEFARFHDPDLVADDALVALVMLSLIHI